MCINVSQINHTKLTRWTLGVNSWLVIRYGCELFDFNWLYHQLGRCGLFYFIFLLLYAIFTSIDTYAFNFAYCNLEKFSMATVYRVCASWGWNKKCSPAQYEPFPEAVDYFITRLRYHWVLSVLFLDCRKFDWFIFIWGIQYCITFYVCPAGFLCWLYFYGFYWMVSSLLVNVYYG